MPVNCFSIFSGEYSPSPPPVHERTTSRSGSVIVLMIRAQRSMGARPEIDRRCAGHLAHLRLLAGLDHMVDIRAARLRPRISRSPHWSSHITLRPTSAAFFVQPGRHFGELSQPARPQRRQYRAGVGVRYARPIHQVPFDDIFEHAARGLVGCVPAQDSLHCRQQFFDSSVAAEAVPVVHAVDPVERPIGDGDAAVASISPTTLIGSMPSERGELPSVRYRQASRQSRLVARCTIWCTTLSPTQARCSRVGQSRKRRAS